MLHRIVAALLYAGTVDLSERFYWGWPLSRQTFGRRALTMDSDVAKTLAVVNCVTQVWAL